MDDRTPESPHVRTPPEPERSAHPPWISIRGTSSLKPRNDSQFFGYAAAPGNPRPPHYEKTTDYICSYGNISGGQDLLAVLSRAHRLGYRFAFRDAETRCIYMELT